LAGSALTTAASGLAQHHSLLLELAPLVGNRIVTRI
jgi:hypothetical protein